MNILCNWAAVYKKTANHNAQWRTISDVVLLEVVAERILQRPSRTSWAVSWMAHDPFPTSTGVVDNRRYNLRSFNVEVSYIISLSVGCVHLFTFPEHATVNVMRTVVAILWSWQHQLITVYKSLISHQSEVLSVLDGSGAALLDWAAVYSSDCRKTSHWNWRLKPHWVVLLLLLGKENITLLHWLFWSIALSKLNECCKSNVWKGMFNYRPRDCSDPTTVISYISCCPTLTVCWSLRSICCRY